MSRVRINVLYLITEQLSELFLSEIRYLTLILPMHKLGLVDAYILVCVCLLIHVCACSHFVGT